MIAGVPCVGQRLGEVPLGQAMLVAVVGDPAGQLGQLAARCGELPPGLFLVAAGHEQAGGLVSQRSAEAGSAAEVKTALTSWPPPSVMVATVLTEAPMRC